MNYGDKDKQQTNLLVLVTVVPLTHCKKCIFKIEQPARTHQRFTYSNTPFVALASRALYRLS